VKKKQPMGPSAGGSAPPPPGRSGSKSAAAAKHSNLSGPGNRKRPQDDRTPSLLPDDLKRRKVDKGKEKVVERNTASTVTYKDVLVKMPFRLWTHPEPHKVARYLHSLLPEADKARVEGNDYERSCYVTQCLTRVCALYLSGLKFDLATAVRLERPDTMHTTMEVARRREDHLVETRRGRADGRFTDTRRTGPIHTTAGARPAINVRPPGPVIRRLSLEEVKRRREKGLCLKCEDKFTLGHQCKQAFVIE
ncbi:Unknown protein, partial [Striga hermonthica]